MITLPWSFKLLYGLIADNFPIKGSRRKSYVILTGLLQFITLFLLAIGSLDNEIHIAILLFINSFAIAFTDVVMDAFMVA